MEQFLVTILGFFIHAQVSTLEKKRKSSPKLRINVLLDYNRGTRVGRDGKSSLTLLSPLKQGRSLSETANVNLGFFFNPMVPKYMHVFDESGLREVFGVHHMKYYVFDDDVIITGANLSESYFTDRQDRYYLLRNVPELCDFIEDMTNALMTNSYQVDDVGALKYFPQESAPLVNPSAFVKDFKHHFKLFLYEYRQRWLRSRTEIEEKLKAPPKADSLKKPSKSTVQPEEHQEFREDLNMKIKKSKSTDDIFEIVQVLDSSITRREEEENKSLVDLGDTVYIMPKLQLPAIKYDDDQRFFEELLKIFLNEKGSQHLTMATGYMNFPPHVIELLSATTGHPIQLITAAPIANGFYNAGFFKKWIPVFYRTYEDALLRNLEKNRNQLVQVREFQRGSWTYHAKGLWMSEHENDLPCLTSIGSSNFAMRSFYRDMELQLYLYSKCPRFKQNLHDEVTFHTDNSKQVTREYLKKDPMLQIGPFSKMFGQLFSSYL